MLTIVGFPIKYYAYRMVPYILAENPQATPSEAILLSRQMMAGQKWRCFVLDLTFILHWSFLPTLLANILGFIIGLATSTLPLCQTLANVAVGVLGLLFVNGYKSTTYTALYIALRAGAA